MNDLHRVPGTSQLNSNGSTSRLASRGKTAAAIAASMLFARNKAAANGGGGGGGGGAGGGSGGEGGGGDGSDSDADMDVEEVTASTAANTDDNHEEEEEDDYNDHQLQKVAKGNLFSVAKRSRETRLHCAQNRCSRMESSPHP